MASQIVRSDFRTVKRTTMSMLAVFAMLSAVFVYWPSGCAQGTPPSITGSVTPTFGNATTMFNFTANYSDADNEFGYVNVIIDGTPYNMTKLDPADLDYSDGALFYYLRTGLNASAHSYHFECSDGNTVVYTAPSAGPVMNVSGAPWAPSGGQLYYAIAYMGEQVNVSVDLAYEHPPILPSIFDLGLYLEVLRTDAGNGSVVWFNISLNYSSCPYSVGYNESTIALMYWNGSAWASPSEYGVNAANDITWANFTFLPILSLQAARENIPPTVSVISVTPDSAEFGTLVSFAGSGTDADGDTIAEYSWRSSIDGFMSSLPIFTRRSLSIGNHTIYFKVKDSNGTWSAEESVQLTITQSDEWLAFGHDQYHTCNNTVEGVQVPVTNATLWSSSIDGSSLIRSQPAVANGLVYFGTLSPSSSIVAMYETNGTVAWQVAKDQIFGSIAVLGDKLFVLTKYPDNTLYCLNALTGAQNWSYPISSELDTKGSPVVVNSHVYFGAYGCATADNLFSIDASTGVKAWSACTGSDITSSVAVSKGRVIVATANGNVSSYDQNNGSIIWSVNIDERILDSSPVISDGIIYVGSNSSMHALCESNGSELWNFSSCSGVTTTAAVAYDTVYFAGFDETIYALNKWNGSVEWSVYVGNMMTNALAYSSGFLYASTYATVSSTFHSVFAVNCSARAIAWYYNTTSGTQSSPAISHGKVFVSTGLGTMTVFSPMADLGIDSIASADTTPHVGQHLNITARLRNYGNSVVYSKVAFYLDNVTSPSLITTVDVVVPMGGEANAKLDWQALDGTHTIIARLGSSVPQDINSSNDQSSISLSSMADDVGWRTLGQDASRLGSTISEVPSGNSSTWMYEDQTSAITVASPVISNGRVIFGMGSSVRCVSLSSGALLWNCATPSAVTATPTVAHGVVYIGTFSGHLCALDEDNGNVIWQERLATVPLTVTPLVVEGLAIIGGMSPTMYAAKEVDGSLAWTFDASSNITSAASYYKGIAYFGTESGVLKAVYVSNGTPCWSFAGGQGQIRSSPVVVDKGGALGIYFGTERGMLIGVDGTGSNTLALNFSQPIRGSPTYYNGKLFFASGCNKLYAFDLGSGNEAWNVSFGISPCTSERYITGKPAVASNTVFVSVDRLYSINASTGAVNWAGLETGGANVTWNYLSPAISNGMIFAGSDHAVYAYGNPSKIPPTANVSWPTKARFRVNESISFALTAQDANGNVTRINWSFGDGSSVENAYSAPTITASQPHSYSAAGSYNVTITVYDSEGLNSVYAMSLIVVNNSKPVLSQGTSDKLLADISGIITFSVVYRDEDGDFPASLKLIISNKDNTSSKTFDMLETNASDQDVTNGKEYHFNLSRSSTPSMETTDTWFRFEASDGFDNTTLVSNDKLRVMTLETISGTLREIVVQFYHTSYTGVTRPNYAMVLDTYTFGSPGELPNTRNMTAIKNTGFTIDIGLSGAEWDWMNISVKYNLNGTTVNETTLYIVWQTDPGVSQGWKNLLGDVSGINFENHTIWTNISYATAQGLGLPTGQGSDFVILIVGKVDEKPNHAPIAKYRVDTTRPEIGKEVVFYASDSFDVDENDTSELRFIWHFMGETEDPEGKIITHIFNKTGNHSVVLTVIDPEGAQDSVTFFITVTEQYAQPILLILVIIVVVVLAAVLFIPYGEKKLDKEEKPKFDVEEEEEEEHERPVEESPKAKVKEEEKKKLAALKEELKSKELQKKN